MFTCLFRESDGFLSHQKYTRTRQLECLQGNGPRQVVDAKKHQILLVTPGGQVGRRRMVSNVLIAIRDHCAASIPPFTSDDVDFLRKEGVGGAHYRPDIEVVLEVLDCHVEVMSTRVKVGDDGIKCPVAILVDDVASITVAQELWVEAGIFGPGSLPWTDTYRRRLRLVHISTIA